MKKIINKIIFLSLLVSYVGICRADEMDNIKLSLKYENTETSAILNYITSKSGYRFIYRNSDFDSSRKISLAIVNASLKEVIDEIATLHKVKYKSTASEILFVKQKKQAEQPKQEQQKKKTITGKVTDQKSQPIPGATVSAVGYQGVGASSNIDGSFSLTIPANCEFIEVSFIGMRSKKIAVGKNTEFNVVLQDENVGLNEVVIVGYASQKKETLTGSISSIDTKSLARTTNASVANSLAGQVTGLSTVTRSGQPGAEDPDIYIRGVGSLTEGASKPLILVDGVERSFFQMDPNEIDNITVLKDASATAVFGVRGANGVILVTTKRGEEGKAKISISSKLGFQVPTRLFEMADSYTYATIMNERDMNDGKTPDQYTFSDYVLDRFDKGDDPLMYPNMDWKDYFMKKSTIQTQHNVSISGGTKEVRYFVSAGFLYQNGILKQLPGQDSNENYKYKRYNYRANLDIDVTPTTLMKIGIGGVVGDKHEPRGDQNSIWYNANWSQPFSSPGIIDNKMITYPGTHFPGILLVNPISAHYNKGFQNELKNTMNIDLAIEQKLDFITKGLKFEVKGAYNTKYTYKKKRFRDSETYVPYYRSEIENPELKFYDPRFDNSIIYRLRGTNSNYGYSDSDSKGRDWYFETSLRYARKFGDHNFSTLVLYNQSKKYYPKTFPELPTAYVGLVGRQVYDYKSKYIAEFNVGYNGSENFAPGKRYGLFPAISLGYVLTAEPFMEKQDVIDYLKIRATIGLVGNDNIGDNRYLYLPDSYKVDQLGKDNTNNRLGFENGYVFGVDTKTRTKGAKEQRIGNPNVTWEKALKKNLGIDINVLDNKLKFSADIFDEDREDILIKRKTIPVLTGLNSDILPVVNMGKVNNKGYELELKWNDKVGSVQYWVSTNLSYSKNKIIAQDEVEPNETYLWRTGHSVGTPFGFVAEGFYSKTDFDKDGNIDENLPVPTYTVYPGDVKYKDLNNDGRINDDDQTVIGHPNRPTYIYGINYGVNWNGVSLTMNWSGAAERTILYESYFRKPFSNESRGLMQFHVDERWTPETANTATFPRISSVSAENNQRMSTLYARNGSYLRLKTVALGYTFSKGRVLKALGMESMKLELSGYNLFTFDNFEVMDPEAKPDKNEYPLIKIYNIGVNITF